MPPYGNYSWCPPNAETVLPLQVFKNWSDTRGVALYVGEYGPSGLGWGTEPGKGANYITAMAQYDIPLSTLWVRPPARKKKLEEKEKKNKKIKGKKGIWTKSLLRARCC